MTWFGWALLALWAFGLFNVILAIGKPRGPLTATVGSLTVFLLLAEAIGVVFIGTGHIVR